MLQQRLIQEIDALGPNYSYEDLDTKVPYMDAIVKESLRLYPPGHLLIRDTTEDLKLKGMLTFKDVVQSKHAAFVKFVFSADTSRCL